MGSGGSAGRGGPTPGSVSTTSEADQTMAPVSRGGERTHRFAQTVVRSPHCSMASHQRRINYARLSGPCNAEESIEGRGPAMCSKCSGTGLCETCSGRATVLLGDGYDDAGNAVSGYLLAGCGGTHHGPLRCGRGKGPRWKITSALLAVAPGIVFSTAPLPSAKRQSGRSSREHVRASLSGRSVYPV